MDGPDKEMEALLPCNPIHGTTPPMLSTLPIGITSFFFKLILDLMWLQTTSTSLNRSIDLEKSHKKKGCHLQTTNRTPPPPRHLST